MTGALFNMLDLKKDLRVRALTVRKAAFEVHGAEASRRLAAHGLDFRGTFAYVSIAAGPVRGK